MIGLYENVVNSINALDNNKNVGVEWYDVVDVSSIDIPNYFIDGGKSNSDAIHEEDEHEDVPFETCTFDDATIGMENLSHCTIDKMRFYLLDIFHDIRFYDEKFKAPIKMKGATSGEIIVPEAEGKLRI